MLVKTLLDAIDPGQTSLSKTRYSLADGVRGRMGSGMAGSRHSNAVIRTLPFSIFVQLFSPLT